MCCRISLVKSSNEIRRRFEIELEDNINRKNSDIRPSASSLVITNENPKIAQKFVWGLSPFTNQLESTKLFNVRKESLATKPIFQNIFPQKRALIIADAYYEWKKSGSYKIKHKIGVIDNEIFAFAGVWKTFIGSDGQLMSKFAIITLEPNEVLSKIHNRMPAILTRENEKLWLDTSLDSAQALELIQPYPSDLLSIEPEMNELFY